MMVGTFVGIMIDGLLQSLEHQENSESTGITVMSAFGKIELKDNSQFFNFYPKRNELTYTDASLGFSISRPTVSWNFNTDVSDAYEISRKLGKESFLGGLYVEQNNDKSFFVGVFNTKDFSNFVLKDFVESQIRTMVEKHNAEISITELSYDNTWAIFGMSVALDGGTVYGEQILEINNGKMYMLQYSGPDPVLMEDLKREEMRKIVDSFTILT